MVVSAVPGGATIGGEPASLVFSFCVFGFFVCCVIAVTCCDEPAPAFCEPQEDRRWVGFYAFFEKFFEVSYGRHGKFHEKINRNNKIAFVCCLFFHFSTAAANNSSYHLYIYLVAPVAYQIILEPGIGRSVS